MKSEFNNTFLTTLTVSYKLLLINRSLYKVIFMTFRKCISLSPFHALCNCWRFCAKNAILHFYVTFKLPNQCQKSQFKEIIIALKSHIFIYLPTRNQIIISANHN